MVQTCLDAGRPPLPAKDADQLFRDNLLLWPLLADMAGRDGYAEVVIDRLKLRNGIEVSDATAQLDFRDDRNPILAGRFSLRRTNEKRKCGIVRAGGRCRIDLRH